MVDLVSKKRMRYGTRRLLPGDMFEASRRDARVLVAVRKAREVRGEANVPAPPPELAEKIATATTLSQTAAAVATAPVVPTVPSLPPVTPVEPAAAVAPPASTPPARTPPADDLGALRAAYEAKVGKRPFMGWDAEELKRRMTAAATDQQS